MDTLHQALPSMSLIASDFSYLPDVSIPGDRAPLVSSKVSVLADCDFIKHAKLYFFLTTTFLQLGCEGYLLLIASFVACSYQFIHR
jgi:hypothetical protein